MNDKSLDLTSKAFQEIRQFIFVSDLKPGEKIPYRKMAEGMDMSLTPIIQALKHMEFLGLVTHEYNRGFVIKKATVEEIEEALSLRIVLEPKLLSIAMGQLTKKGLKKLQEAFEDFQQTPVSMSFKPRLVKDINFHMAIAKLSKQKLSISILKHLFDLLYLRSGQGLMTPLPFDHDPNAHANIFEAIQDRDEARAVDQLRRHLKTVYERAVTDLTLPSTPSETKVF